MWIKCSSLLPKEGMLIAIRSSNFDDPPTYSYEIGIVNWAKDEPSKMGVGYYVSIRVPGENDWRLLLNDSEWKEIEKD